MSPIWACWNASSGSASDFSSALILTFSWMSTVVKGCWFLRSKKKQQQQTSFFDCILHWWQTVQYIYLIFAASSQTLHLRFCCNNTGKRNLRKPVFLSSDMTNIYIYIHIYTCLPVSLTCLNAFMLSRKKCPEYLSPLFDFFFRSAFMNELHDMSCMTCYMKFDFTLLELKKSCVGSREMSYVLIIWY